jgi:hypothetical protein
MMTVDQLRKKLADLPGDWTVRTNCDPVCSVLLQVEDVVGNEWGDGSGECFLFAMPDLDDDPSWGPHSDHPELAGAWRESCGMGPFAHHAGLVDD